MSDAAFLARFAPQFPEWQERPGAVDATALLQLARDLGIADRVEIFRDYDRVLAEHRAGRSILAYTERAPEQVAVPVNRRYETVVVDMDDDTFTLWCPYPSGQSDTLPAAAREWWDRWFGCGVVMHAPTSAK